ncbi:MAG: hypothetical protein AAF533_05645 [Acidobacteriota bacterium]
MSRLAIACLLCTFLSAPLAKAATVVKAKTVEVQSSDGELSELTIDGSSLRLDLGKKQSAKMTMLFDATSRTLTAIDHSRRSFTRIDQKTAQQAQTMMGALDRELARLPEDQRAMAKDAMRRHLNSGAVRGGQLLASPKLINTGASQKWEGYSCERWEERRGHHLIREYLVAPWSELGFSKLEVVTLQEFNKLLTSFSKLSPFMSASAGNPVGDLEAFDGFPVRTKVFQGSKVTEETSVFSAQQAKVAPGFDAIPKGYEEERLPTMSAPGRGKRR